MVPLNFRTQSLDSKRLQASRADFFGLQSKFNCQTVGLSFWSNLQTMFENEAENKRPWKCAEGGQREQGLFDMHWRFDHHPFFTQSLITCQERCFKFVSLAAASAHSLQIGSIDAPRIAPSVTIQSSGSYIIPRRRRHMAMLKIGLVHSAFSAAQFHRRLLFNNVDSTYKTVAVMLFWATLTNYYHFAKLVNNLLDLKSECRTPLYVGYQLFFKYLKLKIFD